MLQRIQGIDWGVELIFTVLHVRASQTCTVVVTKICFDKISPGDMSKFSKPDPRNKSRYKTLLYRKVARANTRY